MNRIRRMTMGAVVMGVLASGMFACSEPATDEPQQASEVVSNELAFHADVRPFDGLDLDTGLQPAASPVQVSLAFKVDGGLSVDARAIGGGSADAPKVAGKAGSGKQKISATLKADAKVKIDVSAFHYEGPLPGIEALAIALDGSSDFDPFLLDSSTRATAEVPETTLPPIPLPGGIPGSIVLTIEKGSFVRSDFKGTCANVTEGSSPKASYVGAAKLDGELVVHATIELKAPLSKKFDVPSFRVKIPAHEVPVDLGSADVRAQGDVPLDTSLMNVGEACTASAAPSKTPDKADSDKGSSSSGGGDTGTNKEPTSCAAPSDCLGATNMGSIAGDGTALATPLTISGTTSKWLTFRVKETDNSAFGRNLKVKATLTAPQGWTFRARMDKTKDVIIPCDSSVYTPQGSSLTLEWGEGYGANGGDDSRTIAIEVQQAAGACPPPEAWRLRVERVP